MMAARTPMHPDTLSMLLALVDEGLGDGEVAREVGLTRRQVQYLRKREGRSANLPAGGAGRWASERRRSA